MDLSKSYGLWPLVSGGGHAAQQSGQLATGGPYGMVRAVFGKVHERYAREVPYERKPEAAYDAPVSVDLSVPCNCKNIQMKFRRKICTCLDQQWVLEEAVSIFS